MPPLSKITSKSVKENYSQLLCEIGKRFAFIEANSVEQINLCKELRHKIYCEEFKWEPETTSGLEINSHDELAKHYLMFDRTEGEFIGTFRIILGADLPIGKLLGEDHILHPARINNYSSNGEVSRFSLLRKYRNTGITPALILFAGYTVSSMGLHGAYMVMEKRLTKFITSIGVSARRLTEDMQLNGVRAVYYISSADALTPIAKDVGWNNEALNKTFEAFHLKRDITA